MNYNYILFGIFYLIVLYIIFVLYSKYSAIKLGRRFKKLDENDKQRRFKRNTSGFRGNGSSASSQSRGSYLSSEQPRTLSLSSINLVTGDQPRIKEPEPATKGFIEQMRSRWKEKQNQKNS